MSSVAIIPARGGSRRIPRKNIRDFFGKPIIAYSIAAAQQSGIFDDVVVSTDDEEVARIAYSYGASVQWRPETLSDDGIGTQEVARHVLLTRAGESGIADDMACVIYATAPMLDPARLREAWVMLQQFDCRYVVPVATWLQDPGQFYMGQAAAFAAGVPLLHYSTRLLAIPPETECDINTMEDWMRAEAMFQDLQRKKEEA